jgi:hypothetical protein
MTKERTLVERLRSGQPRGRNMIVRTFVDGREELHDPLMHEAADEIERLRAELALLQSPAPQVTDANFRPFNFYADTVPDASPVDVEPT